MTAQENIYSEGFFKYIAGGSQKSADVLAGILQPLFLDGNGTILDVGCGQGVWTKRLGEIPGVVKAVGVDGKYVNTESLVIASEDFIAHDLTKPLDIGHRFTLAISLEVGEHLPRNAGPTLVKTLTDHADIVLFSAAIVGQGGQFHTNERPLEYWRQLFFDLGYVALDTIRPRIKGNTSVEPWYRYNSILYVAESALAKLPKELSTPIVPNGTPLENTAPLWWRLRCALISILPRAAVEGLARLKHAVIRTLRKSR